MLLALIAGGTSFDLHDHYKAFAKANQIPSCPFCGLQPMDTEYDPSREAYDHYLPSSVYPFNSVSFKNLAPACHKCNSQYKGAKDPLMSDDGNDRRAFYPYSQKVNNIQISVRFLGTGQLPTEPKELQVSLACPGFDEEVATWDSVYQIKERFSAKCCSPPVRMAWMNRVLIECRNYGRLPKEAFEAELLACDEAQWVEASFLKAAYLREANRVGLISGLARSSVAHKGKMASIFARINHGSKRACASLLQLVDCIRSLFGLPTTRRSESSVIKSAD